MKRTNPGFLDVWSAPLSSLARFLGWPGSVDNSPNPDVGAALEAGMVAFAAEDWKLAIELFSKGITPKSRPEQAPLYSYRCQAYFKLKEHSLAYKDASVLIQLAPSKMAYELRADIVRTQPAEHFRDRCDVRQVLSDYTQALLVEPDDLQIYFKRLTHTKCVYDYDVYRQDLSRAIELERKCNNNIDVLSKLLFFRIILSIESSRFSRQGTGSDWAEISQINPGSIGRFYSYKARFQASHLIDFPFADYLPYILRSNPEVALTYINVALKAGPDIETPSKVFLFSERACLKSFFGDYPGALDDFKSALEVAPGDALTHARLAWLLSTCTDSAIRSAEKALYHAEIAYATKCEGQDQYSLVVATAYAEAGNFKKAIEFEEVYADVTRDYEDPNSCPFSEARLELYRSQRPYRDQKTLGLVPHPDDHSALTIASLLNMNFSERITFELLRKRAEVYGLMGKFELALMDVIKAIKLSEKLTESGSVNHEGYWLKIKRGCYYTFLGDFLNAKADYDELIKINPVFLSERARCNKQMGNVTEAFEDLSKAIGLPPKFYSNRFDRTDDLKTKAEWLLEAGRLKESLDAADQMLKTEYRVPVGKGPDWFGDHARMQYLAEAVMLKVRAYAAMGDYAEAISEPRVFMEKHPCYSGMIRDKLAWIFSTCEEEKFLDGKKARSHVLAAFELETKNSLFETMAAVQARLGLFEEAVKWQRMYLKVEEKPETSAFLRLNLYEARKAYCEPRICYRAP